MHSINSWSMSSGHIPLKRATINEKKLIKRNMKKSDESKGQMVVCVLLRS
jgi:hypothetical protein